MSNNNTNNTNSTTTIMITTAAGTTEWLGGAFLDEEARVIYNKHGFLDDNNICKLVFTDYGTGLSTTQYWSVTDDGSIRSLSIYGDNTVCDQTWSPIEGGECTSMDVTMDNFFSRAAEVMTDAQSQEETETTNEPQTEPTTTTEMVTGNIAEERRAYTVGSAILTAIPTAIVGLATLAITRNPRTAATAAVATAGTLGTGLAAMWQLYRRQVG